MRQQQMDLTTRLKGQLTHNSIEVSFPVLARGQLRYLRAGS